MPLKLKPFIFLIIIISSSLGLSSCKSKSNQSKSVVKKMVQTADSLVVVNKADSAMAWLKSQRGRFNINDPQIAAYYEFISINSHGKDTAATSRYADSALSLFINNPENISQYPDEYFKALLAKGDACIISSKQYETALAYYDKAKKLLSKGSCDNGNLSSKIGGIYFNQQNYSMAARYWVDSYNRLLQCASTLSAQKLFLLKQAALDNTGVSYERAGNYDSAYYYYKTDLDLINRSEKSGQINKSNIIAPRIVVYDNIGGLYLKQGKFEEAEHYLRSSLNLQPKDVNGIRITAMLKLADLYLKTSRPASADTLFEISRRLLDKYGANNPIPYVEWNRLYARYLFAKQKPVAAYQYQTLYSRLKDSLEQANAHLHRLDISREFNTIHRENLITELKHKEKIERLYFVGTTIVAILLLGIIIAINRGLKQSRSKQKSTRLHNEQLQQTLEELERANKNVIRIMRVMAHDLRNPLAGMIGLAKSVSEENNIPEESKQMLRLLEDTGTQSINMINELLTSGLADEREVMSRDAIDIRALLYDSVELLQFKASEKKQKIVFESADDPIVTKVNHEKMWRVFNNLIVNAIKFSYEGGVIYVSIKAVTKDKVLIAIADNGMGIPEKDKEAVFEMFTSAKRPGTDGEQPFGIGLSISKRIVEYHDGRLWFESSPGFGTTFYLELPIV